MARQCVVCHEPMHQQIVHGIVLDSCPTCAGIWFDQNELRRLLDSDPSALPKLDDAIVPERTPGPGRPQERRCPDCDALLTHYRYEYNSPVELDMCDICSGVWVDDGELKKMYQFDHAPLTKEEQDRIDIARFQIQHDDFMERQANLQRLFKFLQVRHVYPMWP